MPARTQASGRIVGSTRRRWLAGTSLPLVAAVAGILAIASWPRQEAPTSVDLTALVASSSAEPATVTATDEDFPANVEYTVQRNDTLDQIFRSVGIDMAALVELRQRPEVRRALDIVRPGDIITFTHVDGALQSLNRQISNTLTLSVARSDDGFAVNYVENPLETEIVGRSARITSSLFAAGQEAGMSAETIMTVANQIFGWDIDFALDLREGDEFSVLYEQKFQDGEYVNDGRVLAAEFVNNGKAVQAFYFEQDGKGGKTTIRKVGLAPVQRDGMEYEFDVTADLSPSHSLLVGKTRCPELDGKSFSFPGEDVAEILKAWLTDGAPMLEREPAPEFAPAEAGEGLSLIPL